MTDRHKERILMAFDTIEEGFEELGWLCGQGGGWKDKEAGIERAVELLGIAVAGADIGQQAR